MSNDEENNCEDDEELQDLGGKIISVVSNPLPIVQNEPQIIFGLLSVKV